MSKTGRPPNNRSTARPRPTPADSPPCELTVHFKKDGDGYQKPKRAFSRARFQLSLPVLLIQQESGAGYAFHWEDVDHVESQPSLITAAPVKIVPSTQTA